eukprot:GHUV01050439.1.p1 GENE.GHUV01050439.1~~GHUV01050439.1.p1  ORF type:complete len:122 (-),score=16.29 GHUV01050439.1:215-580(-)
MATPGYHYSMQIAATTGQQHSCYIATECLTPMERLCCSVKPDSSKHRMMRYFTAAVIHCTRSIQASSYYWPVAWQRVPSTNAGAVLQCLQCKSALAANTLTTSVRSIHFESSHAIMQATAG